MNQTDRKACPCCRGMKPLTDFSPRKGGRHGRASHCKTCHNRRAKERPSDPVRARGRYRAALAQKTPDELAAYRQKRSVMSRRNYYKDRDRILERNRQSRREDPARWRNVQLKHSYGLTLDQYNALLAKQGGVCAICRCQPSVQRKPLAVDHDHRTGAVRGILCGKCNVRLVALDDHEWLATAHEYLNLARGQQAGAAKAAG